jgi:hypothetical protein
MTAAAPIARAAIMNMKAFISYYLMKSLVLIEATTNGPMKQQRSIRLPVDAMLGEVLGTTGADVDTVKALVMKTVQAYE